MVHKADLIVIGIFVGLALGILIATLVFFGIRWYRKYAKLSCSNARSVTVIPIRTNGFGTSTDFSASLSSAVPVEVPEYHKKSSPNSWWSPHSKDQFASASGLPKYSYKDLLKATQKFTTILGEGSFGPVYKASMPTSGVAAVKVLASDSHQSEKEFHTEVCLLGRLHHRNLVNLVGYCVDKGKCMLIFEFMSNGSLATLLYGEAERCLNWDERLQISLDISYGIEYLHEGAVPPVIHRDLKSANILLDQSMRAKVADFGLSKEEVFDGRNSGIKGTYGYIDPEYISTYKFTMKSDVYSFGVIIFELITAIHPHQNLMEYVNLAAMSPDGVDEILDKQLAGECNIGEMRQLAKIAHKCLHKSPRKQPSMGEVTQAILKIKQRRLGKEDTKSMAEMDFSRIMSRIQEQHIELTKLASLSEIN
ncbi:calcium/calmodulin-regulated receptor-like kinase 2 [Hibiscus syriacus]|uniref:calcium/calmodulin-regulated receptor-like kinase 2 n=1 Tax=Hibiscus syriacus TaxID=106335 RepID=UPI001924653E|nr:calcium/calmodulin-regulated receptor-like kinase 2 [Hibiscus syriacus]